MRSCIQIHPLYAAGDLHFSNILHNWIDALSHIYTNIHIHLMVATMPRQMNIKPILYETYFCALQKFEQNFL